MDDSTRVRVGGDRPYDVLIGRGLTDHLVPLLDGAQRVAIVHTASVAARAEDVAGRLSAAGLTPVAVTVPDAEQAKSVGTAEKVWDELGAAGFTRTDAVVGLGGGAVTDLAGFVAACWLRGVRWVPVPTSLLGMVDAAVGGKTGVNTAAGKNLVGAFHPPAGVLCDLEALDSCRRRRSPPGSPRSSSAASSPTRRSSTWSRRAPATRSTRPARCCASWSSGRSGSRPTWSPTTCASRACGRSSTTATRSATRSRRSRATAGGTATRSRSAWCTPARSARSPAGSTPTRRPAPYGVAALGLPVTYRADAWPDLLAAMRVDKKARGSRLRFVVLDGLARPSILDGPSDELLAEAYGRGGGVKMYVLNGPNLGRLGRPQADVYGATTYADLVALCERTGKELGLDVRCARPTPSTS